MGALLALAFAGVCALTWIVCTFVASLASWQPNVKAGRLALDLTSAALTPPLWCATLFAGIRFLSREFARPNAEKPHQRVYSKPNKPIAAKDEPMIHHDATQSDIHRDLLPPVIHDLDSRLGLVVFGGFTIQASSEDLLLLFLLLDKKGMTDHKEGCAYDRDIQKNQHRPKPQPSSELVSRPFIP